VYPDTLLNRNKTVLNSTPDTPLLFLFLQLIIAVVFLHISALFSHKIEIPHWDLYTAKKLLPVVTINIVGLVFNTLCLREVEATFFQVRIRIFSLAPLNLQ
jgi:solute carrier family 35 (GDP-fucose transporter), member C1